MFPLILPLPVSFGTRNSWPLARLSLNRIKMRCFVMFPFDVIKSPDYSLLTSINYLLRDIWVFFFFHETKVLATQRQQWSHLGIYNKGKVLNPTQGQLNQILRLMRSPTVHMHIEVWETQSCFSGSYTYFTSLSKHRQVALESPRKFIMALSGRSFLKDNLIP